MIERIFIALGAAIIGAFLGLFCGGLLLVLVIALPSSSPDVFLVKIFFQYLPLALSLISGVVALFSPDRAADLMGSVTNKIYRLVKSAFDEGAL